VEAKVSVLVAKFGTLSAEVKQKQKTKNQDNCRHPKMAVGNNRFE